MANYNFAAKIILLAVLCPSPYQPLVSSFVPRPCSSPLHLETVSNNNAIVSLRKGQRRNASISATDDGNSINALGGAASLGEKVRTLTIGYIDSLTDGEEDGVFGSQEGKKRRKRVVLDMSSGQPTFTYDVNLPISGVTLDTDVSNRIGISVRQMEESGGLSESCLDLDTLRYVTFEEEVMRNKDMECSEGEAGPDGSIQTFDKATSNMSGVVVTSVIRGSLAWDSGVRAGDVLSATSATLGDVSVQRFLLLCRVCLGVSSLILNARLSKYGPRVPWRGCVQQLHRGRSCRPA